MDDKVIIEEKAFKDIELAALTEGLSVEEFIQVALTEAIIQIEKSKHAGEFSNFLDIYEIQQDPSLLVSQKEKTLIISPDGSHVVLIPTKQEPTP